MTQISGGVIDSDPTKTMCRIEYRLLAPNNRMTLVHYLMLDQHGMPVAPQPDAHMMAPPGTINPAALMGGPSVVRPQGGPSVTRLQGGPPAQPPPQAHGPPPQQAYPPQRPQIPVPKAASIRPVGRPTLLANASKKANVVRAAEAKPHDDSVHLPIDEADTLAQIDVAFARLKFTKGVMARLFLPAERPKLLEEEDADPELLSLFQEQIGLMRQEEARSREALQQFTTQTGERRQTLNRLFDLLGTEETLDEVWSQWQKAAGYEITEYCSP